MPHNAKICRTKGHGRLRTCLNKILHTLLVKTSSDINRIVFSLF